MSEGKTVWVACRGSANCEGKQATVLTHDKIAGGGHITRYRCKSCKKLFVIRV